jgi:predicted dehydrogenase
MTRFDRRSFIVGSLGAAAGALLPASRCLGANDAIRVAVVGFNGRGAGHISELTKIPGVRLVALCDVDPAVLGRHVSALDKQGIKVEGFSDVRKLLEMKDLDAITTATPNHWHSLIGIWACQAGKDSYIEKPISHNVWEGRQLVKAAQKYGRIVQGGTQSRSNGRLRAAVQWVHEGNLGKIRAVYGLCYKARMSIGTGAGVIPAGLDYDLWCGPAPEAELARPKLHYDWHWVHATGNGDMGNQGIHQMDIARWFLGATELSPRVLSIGGRLGYKDAGETPNTQVIIHDYARAPLIFETRGLPKSQEFHDPKQWGSNMDSPHWFPQGRGISVVVDCEGGKVFDGAGNGVAAYDHGGQKVKEFESAGDGGHMENFIQAVRERKPELLRAPADDTHLSSALCHTGMISHQLGRNTSPDEARERLHSDPVLLERYEAMKEHLVRNGVDLKTSQLTLGPWLRFDPKTERFIDNDAANALLTRNYRAPFVVPERV